MLRIESLLSARLFLRPQLVGERIYFLSNLSGRISLYAMNYGGSVPEPLLPPHIALQNPDLIGGESFYVFPEVGQIVLMLDQDGDENYQPMRIPLGGGFPEPLFPELANYRCHMGGASLEHNRFFLQAESRQESMNTTYQVNLAAGELRKIDESMWGRFPDGVSEDGSRLILIEGYTVGDHVLYAWENGETRVLYGLPIEQRPPDYQPSYSSIGACSFVDNNRGLLFIHALFEDTFGLGYLSLDDPSQVQPVALRGVQHHGVGEMEYLSHLEGDRYLVRFNIDGCSWAYEGQWDQAGRCMTLTHVIVGQGELAGGVLEAIYYDKAGDRFALAFSTAVSPTQIYTVEGAQREKVVRHTNERVLGLPDEWLSPGEDASFTSHDGLRVSARLYLPAAALGFSGPRPLVYYIHGGPQGQERPDFAWFSMPLIQFLTLNGFAVFVPNARGSTGYGLSYTKHVDRDWGGQDRLDHVHAMTQVLPQDGRVDVQRAGVVGRSYGGYMTLTLAGRHPELWQAAVDMFGPYDLLTFSERIPETWKPYFAVALGDPVKDRAFLEERSPRTYLHQLASPMLVIQGKNDPRVIERESHDVVENLRAAGKRIEYLMFENEGHDVLKFENRVTCYNAITDFFKETLKP